MPQHTAKKRRKAKRKSISSRVKRGGRSKHRSKHK